MGWWHQIRKTWTALSSRIKLRKSSGVSGGGVAGTGEFSNDCGRTYSGLLILRDDVHMCGYRDVEVMWNMLNVSHRRDQMEAARSSKSAKFSKRGWKHGSMSRVFFWTNHTGGN